MPTSDKVIVFDDFVNHSIVERVWKDVLDQPIWKFGWYSRDTALEYKYWNTSFIGDKRQKELSENKFLEFRQNQPIVTQLWDLIYNKIINRLKVPIQLSRAYGNAYTYGTSGSIHYDDGVWTVLYYGTTPWNTNWRGETLFFDGERGGDKTLIEAVQYVPGRFVIFPAHMFHLASEVAKNCNSVRTIIAFKCN